MLLLDRERLGSFSTVMVENPIVRPKFKPFSTHITVSVSKFSYIAAVLILKRLSECTIFRTVSKFISVL
jgi:hypothetical protein